MNLKQKKQLYLLLNALREDVITDDQFSELEQLVYSDSEAAQEYVLFVKLWTDLQFFRVANAEFNDTPTDSESYTDTDFWQAMASYEKQAPEIEFPEIKPQRELIQNIVYPPREKRKISKFFIFTLVNVAAVLLLFLLLRFAPANGSIEVATLTDSLDAKWVDVKGTMQNGTRLHLTKTPLFLGEGLAMLSFDNKARVVIEGPAEFMILAEDRIGLNYGKVFVNVPEQAVGFSIYTKNAKIIDLGTEFGVDVNTYGDTRLHVIQGKTALIVGERANRVSLEVESGVAKKVTADSLTVSDISYAAEREHYVRHFDSRSAAVWRGQSALCLAEIVGDGDGFGIATADTGIDPTTGSPASMLLETRTTSNDFQSVPSNPYIDGVFVPDGRTPQIVSSQGHLFQDCPATSGSCFNNVLHAVRSISLDITPKAANCLLLHANMGVTYDLQALRDRLPGVTFVRFESKFGIEREALNPALSNADFWVLVDGELRYKKTQVGWGGLSEVKLDLAEKDRFLTLVVTDGGDPEGRIYDNSVFPPIHSDWGMFADPILILDSD